MKKVWLRILAAVLICTLFAGCGQKEDNAVVQEQAAPETTAAETEAGNYVSGDWGEKFVRSNGYTYPFMFDEPLTQCNGFTLEFEILEAEEGALEGNFRFEVYIQTTDGKWNSAELFALDGMGKTLELSFNYPKDVAGVAVVCQKKGGANYNYSIAVRDPV